MCDSQSILIGTMVANPLLGLSIGLPIAQAVSGQEQREAQLALAKDNANLQRQQVKTQLANEAEAAADKSFDLAREALVAKGAAQAQNLGDRSVRAIGRAIGFDIGQDKATIQRNLELARNVAAARLRGIDLTLASQEIQIGDTSGLQAAGEAFSGILSGVQSGLGILSGGLTIAGSLGGGSGALAGGGTQVSQVGSGTNRSRNIA